MIQDIFPHQFHNQYKEEAVADESLLLIYRNQQALVHKTEDALQYPAYQEVKDHILKTTYLFQIDETKYFLGYLKEEEQYMEPYTWEPLSIFREKRYGYQAFAGITGHQLYLWYRDTKFCGRCGMSLEHHRVERMMICPSCGSMSYPKISPAVIVAVTDGDRLLLTKYADRDYKKYALIAGFTEIGETMEETVSREVMEEVGLKVKNIRYYKSQPWSFSSTMLIGFFCELDGASQIKMDENELAVAQWVERKNVPHDDEKISLTREMMTVFFHHGEK